MSTLLESETTDRGAWLTGASAARALAVPGPRAVKRLVAAGLIAVRPLPVQARYSAADVQRLASESATLATARGA